MEVELVRRIYAEKKPGFAVEASRLLQELRADLKLDTLQDLRIINRYDISGLSEEDYLLAKGIVFSEPPVDRTYDETLPPTGSDFTLIVEALPGQYDQRADSAAQCVQILTQREKPKVRTARVYLFYGSLEDKDKALLSRYLINPVESRQASDTKPDNLEIPWQEPAPIKSVSGFRALTPTSATALRGDLKLAMSEADLLFTADFFKTLQRDPTMTELRVLDTYWSDHCRHTTFLTRLTDITFPLDKGGFSQKLSGTFQQYLADRKAVYQEKEPQRPICLMDVATLAMKKLKAEGKLQALDESEEINACSIRIKIDINGEPVDYLLMFKNETHNHPTEIEPFGGAATCLGGAIRDPLSGRAYVYQAMRITGAGDPTEALENTLPGKLPQRKICRTAAAGFSAYGNQIGLATGQVEELYHPGYRAKRLEIGAVIGAAPADAVFREVPKPGDVVILVGGATGRDGIGGATGSSKAHDEESVLVCGSEVQKGNPPTERKLQRLFRNPEVTRLIVRCNDFGAGGVCVAVGELAEGLEINLDAIPKKYEGLDGTELAIAESQERMAVVVPAASLEAFLHLAAAENLEAVTVARITAEPKMVMYWRGEKIVDLPRSFIDTNGASAQSQAKITLPDMTEPYPCLPLAEYVPHHFAESLKAALSSLRSCSRKGLIQRFDSTIGSGTVLMPLAGKNQLTPEEGMVAKIATQQGQTQHVSLMSYGFDPFLSEWSPYHGAYYSVVESLLKLLAMGADPKTAHLTFQEYFERLESPESFGKPLAALLGAYKAQLDYSVAAIGGKDSMSGSFNQLKVPPTFVSFAVATATSDQITSAAFSAADEKVYFLAAPLDQDLLFSQKAVLKLFDTMNQLREKGLIKSCSVPSRDGIAVKIAKNCLGNSLGFSFNSDIKEEFLFTPAWGSIILSVTDPQADTLLKSAGAVFLGQTKDNSVICLGASELDLQDALLAYTTTLENVYPTQTEAEKKQDLPAIFTGSAYKHSKSSIKVAKPRVLIPVFPGTNCEYDSAAAFEQVGAKAEILIIRNQTAADIADSLTLLSQKLKNSQILMIPGGFSGGDEPEGSGKFIAAAFRNPAVTEAVRYLLQKNDGLILGICNGFQALIKLGLLPFGDIAPLEETGPTLTFNQIGRHQSSYVTTKIMSDASPWLSLCTPGELHQVPISHGEGRFVAEEKLIESLYRQGQVAASYTDLMGQGSTGTQWNPNGSALGIEALLSPDGKILGKMAHSERFGRDIAGNIQGNKEQPIFEAGVRYFS